MNCARIVRSALALAVLVVIGGCASSEQWSDWRSHSTHFASDQHMGFSMRNNMEGTNPKVTRVDMDTAPRENWWGKVITVRPDQIFQN
jgi:hypothetical protein